VDAVELILGFLINLFSTWIYGRLIDFKKMPFFFKKYLYTDFRQLPFFLTDIQYFITSMIHLKENNIQRIWPPHPISFLIKYCFSIVIFSNCFKFDMQA